MIITLIAAMAKNRVIGINNQIPWHLPQDFKHFKQTTIGKSIIMGRATYDSIGIALPKRKNIVLTKNANLKINGVTIANSIEQALELAEPKDEVFIIGGDSLYQQTLNIADKIILTVVNAEFNGDAFFPELDLEKWQISSQVSHKKNNANSYDFQIITYKKTNSI